MQSWIQGEYLPVSKYIHDCNFVFYRVLLFCSVTPHCFSLFPDVFTFYVQHRPQEARYWNSDTKRLTTRHCSGRVYLKQATFLKYSSLTENQVLWNFSAFLSGRQVIRVAGGRSKEGGKTETNKNNWIEQGRNSALISFNPELRSGRMVAGPPSRHPTKVIYLTCFKGINPTEFRHLTSWHDNKYWRFVKLMSVIFKWTHYSSDPTLS